MLLQVFIFFQYNISYLRFFVHNEKSLDGYECEEGGHNYNKIKPQIMVVSKVSLSTYCLDFDERK